MVKYCFQISRQYRREDLHPRESAGDHAPAGLPDDTNEGRNIPEGAHPVLPASPVRVRCHLFQSVMINNRRSKVPVADEHARDQRITVEIS